MTGAVEAAIEACVGIVQQAVAPDRPMRVLVLGDRAARACRMLAAGGHEVGCCPDLQRPKDGVDGHADVLSETAVGLLDLDVQVDLIVAVEGWSRLMQVNPPPVRAELIEWMRRHSTVTLVEAPRRILAPDLNTLGPFDVQGLLGGFHYLAEPDVTDESDSLDTPWILASDHHLLVEGVLIPAGEVEWLGGSDPDALVKPVRTYRVSGDRIVKVECTSEDYFERTQVLGEWAFLTAVADDVRARLDLPLVHSLVRGRAVTTLVRDDVAGGPGDGLTLPQRLAGILEVAGRYAEVGVFHNDVRPWNVVWHHGRARMIDFADASPDDDDVRDLPQVLALAGTLAAVATDEIRGGEHFHLDVLELAQRAGLLERWPLRSQLGAPWSRVPHLRDLPAVATTRPAADIMREVLEVTVG